MDNRLYMSFTANYPIEDALRRYREKYGCEPKGTFVEKRLLKLGPIPEVTAKVTNALGRRDQKAIQYDQQENKK